MQGGGCAWLWIARNCALGMQQMRQMYVHHVAPATLPGSLAIVTVAEISDAAGNKGLFCINGNVAQGSDRAPEIFAFWNWGKCHGLSG